MCIVSMYIDLFTLGCCKTYRTVSRQYKSPDVHTGML